MLLKHASKHDIINPRFSYRNLAKNFLQLRLHNISNMKATTMYKSQYKIVRNYAKITKQLLKCNSWLKRTTYLFISRAPDAMQTVDLELALLCYTLAQKYHSKMVLLNLCMYD